MQRDSPWRFGLRAAAVAALVVAGILVLDQTHLFQPPLDTNPHVEKRWEALKQLQARGTDIDVLVVGNSHSYTGINPKLLSAELGLTTFVLANNGTNWADSKWMIREALNHCAPVVIVLETYGCDATAPGGEYDQHFVDQVRAFNARSDRWLKWQSAPELFGLSELPLALSPTLLNHHYVWTDPEWMEANWERGAPVPPPPVDGLFLGRFVRFTSGLSDSLLARYRTEGPAVDGAVLEMSGANLDAGRDIAELCAERGIALALLSLPMFEAHVTNMEDWTARREAAWAERMPGVPHWDFQAIGDLASTPEYFENTYRANQHMTRNGSYAASGHLAARIRSAFGERLSRRDTTARWHALFRGEEGYYAFQDPLPSDSTARTWAEDVPFESFVIEDIRTFQPRSFPNPFLQLRLRAPDSTAAALPHALRSQWLYRMKGDSEVQRAIFTLDRMPHLSRAGRANYRVGVNPDVELLKIEGVAR